MSHISKVQINSGSYYKIEPILYGSCSTAASTAIKDVLLVDSSGYELTTGIQIAVNFSITNTAAVDSLKLRVESNNADDAKPIKYMNTILPSADVLTSGKIYNFVYDGTSWNIIGDLNKSGIVAATSAQWATNTSYIAPKDTIIIYTDGGSYTNNNTTITVPKIKISDGLAYVVDLPFVGDDVAAVIRSELSAHVNDAVKHITSTERTFWNNKLNCDISGEILVLNRS